MGEMRMPFQKQILPADTSLPGGFGNGSIKILDRLGLTTTLCLLSLSVLSYFLAASNTHYGEVGLPNQAAFFDRLAAFIHQGNERSGRRAEVLSVGLYWRTPSAAALMAA